MAILYADRVTESMKRAIGETDRRRARQVEFNAKRGITPIGISKQVHDMIEGARDFQDVKLELKAAQEQARYESMSEKQLAREIKRLEKQMVEYARNLEFEKAAEARDRLAELKRSFFGASPEESARAAG
jgi:excinuclease ABC subunit B